MKSLFGMLLQSSLMLIVASCGSSQTRVKPHQAHEGTPPRPEVDAASQVLQDEEALAFRVITRAPRPVALSDARAFTLSSSEGGGLLFSLDHGVSLSAPWSLAQWSTLPAPTSIKVDRGVSSFAVSSAIQWIVGPNSLIFQMGGTPVTIPWPKAPARVFGAREDVLVGIDEKSVSVWTRGAVALDSRTFDLPDGVRTEDVQGAGALDGYAWIHAKGRLHVRSLSKLWQWSKLRVSFAGLSTPKLVWYSGLNGTAEGGPERAAVVTAEEVVVLERATAVVSGGEGKPATSTPSVPGTTPERPAPSSTAAPVVTVTPAATGTPAVVVPTKAPTTPTTAPDFETQVKPVLMESCIRCHSKYGTRSEVDKDRYRIRDSVEAGSMPKNGMLVPSKKTILIDYVTNLINRD